MGGLGGKAGGRGTVNVVMEEAASAGEVVVARVAPASVAVGVVVVEATSGVGVVVDDVLLMVKASSPTLLLESLASLLFPSLSCCCSCRGW